MIEAGVHGPLDVEVSLNVSPPFPVLVTVCGRYIVGAGVTGAGAETWTPANWLLPGHWPPQPPMSSSIWDGRLVEDGFEFVVELCQRIALPLATPRSVQLIRHSIWLPVTSPLPDPAGRSLIFVRIPGILYPSA